MLTKEQKFRSSDDARATLARFLADPVVISAFEIVHETGIPKEIPKLDSRNHPDTCVSHEFYKMVGVNSVPALLERLTYPLNEHPLDGAAEEAYAHSLKGDLAVPLSVHQERLAALQKTPKK